MIAVLGMAKTFVCLCLKESLLPYRDSQMWPSSSVAFMSDDQ